MTTIVAAALQFAVTMDVTHNAAAIEHLASRPLRSPCFLCVRFLTG
jgi:hypothetical protein